MMQPLAPVETNWTRLYHLPLIGVGTAEAESLTTHIARLAVQHVVTVQSLFHKEIWPATADGRRLTNWSYQSRVMNGSTGLAERVRLALEALTGHSDLRPLTMAAWARAIPPVGLISRWRAWCPACLAEAQRSGGPVYEPLLWALSVVNACPNHGLLVDLCPSCRSRQQVLTPFTVPGHCGRCLSFLGQSCCQATSPPSSFDLSNALMIGELIAASPMAAECGVPDPHRTLRNTINVHFGGSYCRLAKAAGVPKHTAKGWADGDHLPNLRNWVRIAASIGLPLPVLLLRGPGGGRRLGSPLPAHPSRRRRRPLQAAATERLLHEFLREIDEFGNETVPLSLNEVARRMGRHPRTLRLRFPSLCEAIAARRRRYLSATSEVRIAAALAEVRGIVHNLAEGGINPTRGAVTARMTKQGYMRSREVRAAYFDEVCKAGFTPPVSLLSSVRERGRA